MVSIVGERERRCAREVFLELSDLFRERHRKRETDRQRKTETEKGGRGRERCVRVCIYMYVAYINIYTYIDVCNFILMIP